MNLLLVPSRPQRRRRRSPRVPRLSRLALAALCLGLLAVVHSPPADAITVTVSTTYDSYYAPTNGLLTIGSPGVLGNDSGTGALTAALVNQATHGTVSLSTDGSFTYTPGPDWGTSAVDDHFTYTATDSISTSSNTTVLIHGPSTWTDAEITGVAPASAALSESFDSSFTVTNHGPSAITSGALQIHVAGALLVSAEGPAGWYCIAGLGVVTCYVPAGGLAVGASVNLLVHKTAPPGPNVGYQMIDAGIFSADAPDDPFPVNDTFNVQTLLTGPQATTTTSTTSTTSTTPASTTTTVATDPSSTTSLAPTTVGADAAGTTTSTDHSQATTLPVTGSDPAGVVVFALALATFGGTLLVLSRRRRLAPGR